MSEMKSAFERAMERVEKLGQPTEEERMRWKHVPDGERLAADYLRGKASLQDGLAKAEAAAAPYIKEGIRDVLLANLALPTSEAARSRNDQVMDGLREIARDKRAAESILAQVRNIFQHHDTQGEQQRQQAYQQVKQEFGRMLQQAMQQQYGDAQVPANVEGHPQFQQEWRRVQGQLNSQYEKLLEEYKQQLVAAV